MRSSYAPGMAVASLALLAALLSPAVIRTRVAPETASFGAGGPVPAVSVTGAWVSATAALAGQVVEDDCDAMLPAAGTVDWVVFSVTTASVICERANGEVVLSNGIVERRVATSPNGSTTSLKNLYTATEMLHEGGQPEAVVSLDGNSYAVGGSAATGGFVYSSHSIEEATHMPYEWTPYGSDDTVKPWSEVAPWPAKGKSVVFSYTPHGSLPAAYRQVTVKIRYEIYDGIAAMMKKVIVENGAADPVELRGLTLDRLRIKPAAADLLLVDTDYHGGQGVYRRNDYDRTYTRADAGDYHEYTVLYKVGPAFHVGNRPAWGRQRWETTFESFRSFLLLHSTAHYEAQRMEFKKMYRTIAPQLREDLLFFHAATRMSGLQPLTREAANVGFEAILQSFWTGFQIWNDLESYRSRRKGYLRAVRNLGLLPGAYMNLLKTPAPIPDGAGSRCPMRGWGAVMGLASWGNLDYYQPRVRGMIEEIGLEVLEIDAAYPLTRCDKSDQDYMVGGADSQHKQWTINNEMYAYLRARDIYVNASDWHFLNGANKSSIGYEEDAWSRPRGEQLLLDRMYIYNGTYEKSPPWAWSVIPNTQYQRSSTRPSWYAPQSQNFVDYHWAVAQNFLSGVQHTFRGRSLFDTDKVEGMLKYWVDVYKTYRGTLKGDIVHIRPPKRDPENWARAAGIDASSTLLHRRRNGRFWPSSTRRTRCGPRRFRFLSTTRD